MQLELVFIRHGQTAGNEQRRYIGQSDDQPLSEAGRAQLQEWQAAKKYPPADALYVSPLARCQETARILYPMLVPVTIPSLVEVDLGIFEGKTYEQLKDEPSFRRWIDSRGMTPPPGGEGGKEIAQRLMGALRQIADDAQRCHFKRAAVITHGGCIMTLFQQLDVAPGTVSMPTPRQTAADIRPCWIPIPYSCPVSLLCLCKNISRIFVLFRAKLVKCEKIRYT